MLKELQSLGLEEKEARVYAAAIELGTSSAAQLAEKSGVKRPSVYLHLPQMVADGLMERIRVNKKTLYKPADPSIFEEKVNKNLSVIDTLKKDFTAHRTQRGMPQISVYEGLENIKPLYKEIGEATFIRLWSNIGPMHAVLKKEFETLAENINKNGINVREIIADTKESRRLMQYLKRITGPTHFIKVASQEGVNNDNIVTNRALYIFRLHEYNFFAARIEDATVVATYRALFDMAWKNAKGL